MTEGSARGGSINGKDRRREQLSDFLRTRRARLSPNEVGLPPSGTRRRTPGLRREEVALLADVGITWYTWLEQGRPIKISADALERVARALRLAPEETRHLFVLAERTPPPSLQPNGEVPEGLAQLLDGLDRGSTPAFVRDEHWDILAWNRTMGATLTDFGGLAEEECNALYMLFAHLGHYGWLADWQKSAQHLLARFRAVYGRYGDDERFGELIERCRQVSPEFDEWWALHDVAEEWSSLFEIEHPVVGRLSFTYASFHPAGPPEDLELVTYTPVAGTATEERIAGLMASIAPAQQPREG